MRKAGEGGQLLTPRGTAASGHHRTRIPMQHGGGFVQRGNAREAGLQAFIGGSGHQAAFLMRQAKAAKTPIRERASPYQVMA